MFLNGVGGVKISNGKKVTSSTNVMRGTLKKVDLCVWPFMSLNDLTSNFGSGLKATYQTVQLEACWLEVSSTSNQFVCKT